MPTRSVVLAAALASALAASTALAGGINLSWDACGSVGVAQKNFACNTNSGNDELYVSAIPAAAIPALNGHESTIRIATPTVTLPSWWQKQNGGCRPSTTFASVDFTAAPTHCRDVWQGFAVSGVVYDYPVSGFPANFGRIRTVSALQAGFEESVNATDELYIVRILLTHAKSTGVGSCAGCTESACIVLESVKLYGPQSALLQTLTNPILRQHVYWQNSAPLAGCPAATPARQPTWGGVKSLYR